MSTHEQLAQWLTEHGCFVFSVDVKHSIAKRLESEGVTTERLDFAFELIEARVQGDLEHASSVMAKMVKEPGMVDREANLKAFDAWKAKRQRERAGPGFRHPNMPVADQQLADRVAAAGYDTVEEWEKEHHIERAGTLLCHEWPGDAEKVAEEMSFHANTEWTVTDVWAAYETMLERRDWPPAPILKKHRQKAWAVWRQQQKNDESTDQE